MPQHNLNALGSQEFERMCQTMLKEVIGSGTVTFGAGRDGAREATFEGHAPYPSATSGWDGSWIFQVKFHDTALLGVDKARKALLDDLKGELQILTQKYKLPCDNYIMITNVPLTGVAGTGMLDVIKNDIIPNYRGYIRHIHIWGADDVNRLLEKYSSVRNSYIHLMTAGDLISKLIDFRQQSLDDVALTIKSYLNVTLTRDQNAQLDQAGDVSDDQLQLQNVFFDLGADIDPTNRSHLAIDASMRPFLHQGSDGDDITAAVRFLLSEASKKVVLVGGPGEGKSTIGQYLAQLHRAILLGRVDDVAITPDYIPSIPRIPLRITLREFGQWLAERHREDEQLQGTLEEYICIDIERSTSRQIQPQELHHVIQENPTLLILDGLDEVTDLGLRRTLLVCIHEFTTRCESVLKADLQILASTRPTGYVEQFDPRTFLHLRLTKLNDEQVKRYVARWTKAKNFDPTKTDRIIRVVDECLNDRQISLLTTTPLQVTILLLIISSGGKPQYQREALFNEYLDIIYRRETAKGRNIIESERELLIGLHQYIGYILHEEATHAATTSAVLPFEQYAKNVARFLRWNDPIASEAKQERDLTAITKEAGERLVLIIEPSAKSFGFELRSIQEFFAACHLTDTSRNTEQRYSRFDAIARLPHWRNVALFFAGRVGRNYPGEASNVVEICRAIDREAPGSLTKQGGGLAMELAADRAFGPNRRLQQSLIELGLQAFDDRVSPARLNDITEHILRLSADDQRELVLPLLKNRVELLPANRLEPILRAIHSIDAISPSISIGFNKMAAEPENAASALTLALSFATPSTIDHSLLCALTTKVGLEKVGQIVSELRGAQLACAVECFSGANLVRGSLASIIRKLVEASAFIWGSRDDFEFLSTEVTKPWPSDELQVLVRCLVLFGYLAARTDWALPHSDSFPDTLFEESPAEIRTGAISALTARSNIGDEPILQFPLWIIHLLFGDVTKSSARAFLAYYRRNSTVLSNITWLSALPWDEFPVIDLVIAIIRTGLQHRPGDVEDLLVRYGGLAGRERWRKVRTEVHALVMGLPNKERQAATCFGLTAIQSGVIRDAIRSVVSTPFASVLSDYAVADRTTRYAPHLAIAGGAIREMAAAAASDKILSQPRQIFIRRILLPPRGRRPAAPLAFTLSILRNLIDVPYSTMSSGLIPQMLAAAFAAGPVPEDLVRLALTAAGQEAPGLAYLPPSYNNEARMLASVVPIACEAKDSTARRGARSVVLSCAAARHYGFYSEARRPTVRFRGFAALHRLLARDADEGAQSAAIGLFAVRVPSSAQDWDMLAALILGCQGDEDVFWLGVIRLDEWDDEKLRERAIEFLQEIIPKINNADVLVILVDWLETLLAKGSQSLQASEEQLGLPLQPIPAASA